MPEPAPRTQPEPTPQPEPAPPAQPAPASQPAQSGGDSVPFPLQQNETITMICRRHWIHLWPQTLWLAAWGIVPVAIIAWILSWAGVYDGTTAQIFWIISVIWLIYWAVRIFLNWYRYHHDIWVITNQRIVDSTKRHPFHHRLSSADLVNVQDMTVERRGILQTTLNYGSIICQTASTGTGDFVLSGIPDPNAVQLLVDKERDRERMRR
jgi:hypothetical protein